MPQMPKESAFTLRQTSMAKPQEGHCGRQSRAIKEITSYSDN